MLEFIELKIETVGLKNWNSWTEQSNGVLSYIEILHLVSAQIFQKGNIF